MKDLSYDVVKNEDTQMEYTDINKTNTNESYEATHASR